MNNKVTYRQQFTRCGKQRCRKCREGAGHGPYWYAYWSENGRTVSKYIGIKLPPDVEQSQQAEGEIAKELASGTPSPGSSSSPSPASPHLRIYLLGQFRIERLSGHEWMAVDSRTWHRRRARALLGCLLSSPGRRLGREQVMELLWPDLDIDVAANRLNGAVHELRQILEPEIARPANSRMLRLERDILELADRSHIWVDAETFEHLLKEANSSTDPQQTERLLEEANSLYKGNYLLEELYSEWAAPRRDALQRAWVGLLLSLTNLRVEQGAYAGALETLDRLRIADPANETALQRLMILLTQLDRRGEALQVYRQHVTMLQKDYESEPLAETTELYEALRQSHVPTLYAIRPTTSTKETGPQTSASSKQRGAAPQEASFTRPLFQPGRHNQSPLIGRDQELDTMRQVLLTVEALATPNAYGTASKEQLNRGLQTVTSSSRARRPHFILLRGEAGIGKTRLAEEISLEAYTRGWAVAWSRSYEQEGTIPYHPWTELLRTLLKGANTLEELEHSTLPDGSSQLSPIQSKLERLSTLLPELGAVAARSTTRPIPVAPHEQERLHLWEAASGLLGTLSKIHPLLLVLDDLHWTDESSLELLTYLTHHLQDQRIILIGTCRDGELAPQHKLHTLVADLRREQAIVTIHVNPLTHSQIDTLLAHLPKDAVQNIQTQAAGNPFFAEELARYAGSSSGEPETITTLAQHKQAALPANLSTSFRVGVGVARRTGRERPQRLLPEPIAAVLERRLSRLSSGCQVLLGKAAVLGGSFELSQLLPMANEQDEDTILDLLEEALHAGLLTEEGTAAHITYHFWHPLIISHLYERLSAARRAQMHRRAAESIKASHTSSQPEKVAATIVYHLTRGGGDPAQIAYYAEQAGNQAHILAAYTEAQQYYLQALQALVNDRLPIAEDADVHSQIQHITTQVLNRRPQTNPLHICTLLEHVAECSMVSGNYEEARHLYECILNIRTADDFFQTAYLTQDEGINVEALHKREAQIQALLWRETGNTWTATGDYTQAYDCYAQGKAVIAQADIKNGAAWACLHMQYGEMLRLQGRYQQSRHYLQEALATLEQVVRPAVASNTGLYATRPAQIHDALATDKALQTRTERALIGDPLEIGYAHERLGIVAASVGQLSEALQHLHITLNIFEQSELVSEMARVCGNLGVVYATKGAQTRAFEYMQRSLNLAERTGDLPNMTFITGNLGDMAHRAGKLLESERWFQRSLSLAEQINDRERISWFSAELAAVQQDLGNFNEAATHLRRALLMGRAIQSSRCIHYALAGLGNWRIGKAILDYKLHGSLLNDNRKIDAAGQRLFYRAQSTLQRAIASGALEAEAIIESRHLLATIRFLENERDTAYEIALEALKEAQENEIARMIGRTYCLLGRILTAKERYAQAEQCFENALHIGHEHELLLDYARARHSYGICLLQRWKKVTQETDTDLYQQGIAQLHEARSVFEQCHASIDLSQSEQVLSTYEPQNARR
jgi:predicted ATPase/DNA-binding SARP family transcriptional activator